MKLKALDTLHISAVKSDNIAPGEAFEVSEEVGKSLIERGLAVAAKAAAKPANKMAAAPGNKAARRPKGK
jgi:hypothetical protein